MADAVPERRSRARVRQCHREPLIGLHHRVPRHVDRDRLRRLSAAKLTVPLGSAPPTKSEADAGLAPLPASDQDTLFAEPVLPVRVTVNVNGVVPDWPSALSAASAKIAKTADAPGVVVPVGQPLVSR